MKNFLLIGMLAGTAAWLFLRANSANRNIVPAEEAAAKLRQAWADHHAA